MAKSNVEVARELTGAWNRSDWEAMADLFWPDAEAIAPRGWPEAGDSRGWEAVQRQFARLKDSWTDERFELASTEAIDDQRVLQHGHWRGAGRESGIPLDLQIWFISTFRDGKIAKVVYYLDHDEAMRAAGR
jgi:ketosteroid isomerase-like protein